MERYYKMSDIVIQLDSLVTKISDYQTSLDFDSSDLSGLLKYIELKEIKSFSIKKDNNDVPYQISLFSLSTHADKVCKIYSRKEDIIKALEELDEKAKIDIDYTNNGRLQRIAITSTTKIIERNHEAKE